MLPLDHAATTIRARRTEKHVPDGQARETELSLHRDGTATVSSVHGTSIRWWDAVLDPYAWRWATRALAALRPGVPSGACVDAYAVTVDLDHRQVRLTVADAPEQQRLTRFFDSLITQISSGQTAIGASWGEIPRLAYRCRARETENAVAAAPAENVALGTVRREPVAVTVTGDGEVLVTRVGDDAELGRTAPGPDPAHTAALLHTHDRDLLISAGRTMQVWDFATGELLHARTGPRSPIYALATADIDDEQLVFAAAASGQIWSWTLDGDERGVIQGWEGAFNTLATTQIETLSLLAAGGDDGTVRIWDLADGTALHTFETGQRWIATVAFTGNMLAAGGPDGIVRVWDPLTGESRHRLTGHTTGVTAIAAHGAVLAAAGLDGTVRTWDIRTGRPLRLYNTGGWITGLRTTDINGNPGLEVTESCPHARRAWDPAKEILTDLPPTPTTPALGLCEPADGPVTALAAKRGVAIAATALGVVRIHCPDQGTDTMLTPHRETITRLATAVAGETPLIATAADDGDVRVWHALTGLPLLRIRPPDPVRDLALGTLGGHPAVFVAYEDRVAATSVTSGETTLTLQSGLGVRRLTLGANLIAAGDENGAVTFWRSDGVRAGELPAAGAAVTALAIDESPGQARLAVGYEDRTVRVWHLPDRQPAEQWEIEDIPHDLAWSAPETLRVAGRQSATVINTAS